MAETFNPIGAWATSDGELKSGSDIAQNFFNPMKLGGIFAADEEEEESDDNQEIIDDAVKTNKTRSALLMTEGQELGQELQAGEVGTRDTFFGN